MADWLTPEDIRKRITDPDIQLAALDYVRAQQGAIPDDALPYVVSAAVGTINAIADALNLPRFETDG